MSGFESANVVWGSGSRGSDEGPATGPAIGIPASGRAPVLEAADVQVRALGCCVASSAASLCTSREAG